MKFKFLEKKLEENRIEIESNILNRNVHQISKNHVIKNRVEIDFSEYYNFCIIRNPFTRITSAFLDKFVREETTPNYARQLMKLYGSKYKKEEEWTFSEFISAIQKSPVENLNEHWMPIYMHLIKEVDYDFVQLEKLNENIRLRNIYGDLSKNIREHSLSYRSEIKYSHETPISELREELRKAGWVPSWQSLCHPDLQKSIISVYEPDFELVQSLSKRDYASSNKKIHDLAESKLSKSKEKNIPKSDMISIIVPVYNVESFIKDCMESLQKQTDRNFEVIVIDDESSDKSIDIVRSYSQHLPSLRILRQVNRGLGGARNTGINLAEGDFITFVDSDDVVEPNYIELLRKIQKESDADIVSGGFRKIDEMGAPIDREVKEAPSFVPPLAAHEEVLGTFRQSVAWARLYRKSLIEQSGISFPERVPHEDLFFTYKILSVAERAVSTDKIIYNWRQRAGSLGKSITSEHIDILSELRHDTRQFIERKSATERELVLSARRNIALLNFFLSKARKVNRQCLSYLKDSMIQNADEITADINMVRDSGIPSGPVKDIVDVIGAAHQISSQITDGIRQYDFVFFPLRAYHLMDSLPVCDRLKELGFSFLVVETDDWRDGKDEVRRAASEIGIEVTSFSELQESRPKVRCCVVWNDWDPLMRAIMAACHDSGTETIGWIEGIQDYHDVDRGRGFQRAPYLRSRHLILPGSFDSRYFQSTGQRLHFGEVVRIARLWQEGARKRTPTTQKQPRALINSNFSYGVLEDKRDAWVSQAVESCKRSGFQPVISRHPFDKGDAYPEYTSTESFYETIAHCDVAIQRFSSGILEALAIGVPTIYFNPHDEKVDKFTEPNGAFLICFRQEELANLLDSRCFGWSKEAAQAFLANHCGLSEELSSPGEKIVEILRLISDGTVLPIRSFLTALKPLPEPGKLGQLRKITNSIPPFFGMQISSYPDLSTENSSLAYYSASLLLDPKGMIKKLATNSELTARINATLKKGGATAAHYRKAFAWAEDRAK